MVTPIALIALAGSADAAPGVLVWSDPSTSLRAGSHSAAVRDAGFEPVEFGPIAARLDSQREAARELERDTLAAVQTGLAEVKQAYLEQRFDDMIAWLTRLEGDALPVLAQPEHAGVLWEIEFQLGLAYQSRGDAALARERFELALSIDAERRPLKDLYGPEVAGAFADAVAARTGKTPRPIAIRVTPGDARVAVDGVPMVDPTRPRSLRHGLHVVRARAPGHATRASLVTVGDADEIAVALTPAREQDADATPDTVSGLRAIRLIAGDAGAAAVVFVEGNPTTGATRVRVVTADAVSAPVDSVADALALLAPDGTLRDAPEVPIPVPGPTPAPIYEKWWFWTAVGAVAVTAVAIGFAASDDPGHIRVFAPGEGP